MRAHLKDYALILALAAMWSSSFVAVKIGVETAPPIAYAWARIGLAGVILYGVLKMRGGRLPRRIEVWGWLALFGLFGNALPFVLINWGQQNVDAGLAAILISVMPLSALLLAHVFTRDERLTPRRLAGVVLGFAGVVVLIGPGALADLGSDVAHQLAVAGGAVCYAIGAIVARWLPPLEDYERGSAILIVSALMLVPAMFAFEGGIAVDFTNEAWWALAYLAVFPTALATILLFWVIARRGATFLALNNYLIPGLGVFWGWLFLSETVSTQEVLALFLILGGIAVAGSGSKLLRGKT